MCTEKKLLKGSKPVGLLPLQNKPLKGAPDVFSFQLC